MIQPFIKIIFAGEPGVGKTSIVKRIVTGEFNERYIRTLNVFVYTGKINIGGRTINIGFRDPRGHRPISHYVRPFVAGANVAILVFDISRPDTLFELGFRVSTYLAIAGPKPMILIGNKKDLREETDYYVKPEEGKAFAERLSKIIGYKVPYLETSAKTGENMDKIPKLVIAALLKKEVEARSSSTTR